MAYRLRSRDGPAFLAGTWIAADGTADAARARRDPPTPGVTGRGRRPAVARRLARWPCPARRSRWTSSALNAQSWMGTSFPYWEGPVRVTGSHAGRGYLEMTGY